MWFGLAPSPPSRPSSRAWRPPSCTCALCHRSQCHHHNHHAAAPCHPMLSPRKQREEFVPHDDAALKHDLVRMPHPAALHGPMTSPRAARKQDKQQPAAAIPHHARRTLLSRKQKTRQQSALTAQQDAASDFALDNERHEPGASQPEHAAADHLDTTDGNNAAVAVEFAHIADTERLNTVRTPKAARRASKGLECTSPSTVISSDDCETHSSSSMDALEGSGAAPLPRSRRPLRAAILLHHDPHSATDSASRGDRDLLSFLAFPRLEPENLVGHTSSVCFVATTDDRFVVSCSSDVSVKVWSRSTYACLHTLFGHKDNVPCVDLHARWLVSGSHDTTLRVYSCLDSFRCLHVLRGHTAHITKVHLPLSRPQHILSCSDDATIRIWHGERGHCVFVLRDHSSRITCFYMDGDKVCSGAADAAICFWDIRGINDSSSSSSNNNNGRKHHQQQQQTRNNSREIHAAQAFYVHSATVQTLVATSSIEGALLLSGSNDGTIHLFNLHTMDYIGQLDDIHSPIYSMCLLSHGHLVCSTGDGRLLQYSDLYSHSLEKSELKLAPARISSLQLRGDMLVCSFEGLLYLVDAEQLRVHTVIETMHGFVNSVGWLHANTLISGGQDNVIKIWHIA